MIYSRLRSLRFNKEESEGRKLTFQTLSAETGVAVSTLQNFMKRNRPIERVDSKVVTTLCNYFAVDIGGLLTLTPDGQASAEEDEEEE